MREILAGNNPAILLNNVTAANSSDISGTEFDSIQNDGDATLVLSVDKGTTGVSNVSLHSSHETGFSASSSNRCQLIQNIGMSASEVTVSDDTFSITADGLYVFLVIGTKRFINIEYDGEGDSKITAVLIAHGSDPKWSSTSSY
ncbi:MAG: hypothetical protein KAV00_03650 [Phycisphaerae bacterium]|nr:hypothetical protein [Phycisphaerae bacterium]